MAREWQYYTGPGGGDIVLREIKKAGLTPWEVGRLEELMDRVACCRTLPGDVNPLRDGVLETRLDGDRRIFRLAYAEVNGGLVLLALHFFPKKKERERAAVDLAISRLKEWKRRVSQR